jgi:hypothetical protein
VFQVTFNEPVTVSTGWSLSVNSDEEDVSAILNSSNSTANAAGDVVTYTVISTVVLYGTGGFYIGGTSAYAAIVYAQTGVNSSGLPWNIAGSNTDTNLANNPGTNDSSGPGAVNPGLSVVFDASNYDYTDGDGPTVNSVTTGGIGTASVNLTCDVSTNTVYIYDGGGNAISAPTACTGSAQTILTTTALASGETIQTNEIYTDGAQAGAPADYYETVYQTTAYLIP